MANRSRCLQLALAAITLSLCCCDFKFFDSDAREIASGYRLKRSPGSNEFSLTIPYQSGGLIVDEIGWSKPFIVARGAGSQYWDVINTARAQHTRVSDRDLRADLTFQTIEAKKPDIAWNDLGGQKPIW
jgi:hypothetical protein